MRASSYPSSVASADKGVVDSEFNLGSKDPPEVHVLLRNLISSASSRSTLVPTPASAVKWVLRALDRLDASIMVPEQYEIADADHVIDISHTKEALGWTPRYSDQEMFNRAYRDFIEGEESTTTFAQDW